MNPLKKLAGETVIYGVPTILGRFLYFLLIKLHTSVLSEGEYGTYTYLYSYTAFFLVIYTMGMETSYFRFATKDNEKDAYNQSFTFLLITGLILTIILWFGSDYWASLIGNADYSEFIKWLALILFVDAITAIPFARLRLQRKAIKFASAKLLSIFIQIGIQVFFLLICEKVLTGNLFPGWKPFIGKIYNPDNPLPYLFAANLIGNGIAIVILYKSMFNVKLGLTKKILKPMLIYALPIMAMGLTGMANDNLDKILMELRLPDNFYEGLTSQEALGVYGAAFKLSMVMGIAVQAFRFAGEPFFFSQSKEKNSPELFAKVTYYFMVFGVLIWVGISLNLELLSNILLGSAAFKSAIYIVPVLLFGKLLYGLYVNLSIWFKLSDKTYFGTLLSIAGAFITLIGNYFFIPVFGYWASAVTLVLSYFTMVILSAVLGNKHFPIPYQWLNIIGYIVAGGLIIFITDKSGMQNGLSGILITSVIVLLIFLMERKKIAVKTG
ncbi:lipopolysaccharide biosynthesis protein [Marinigracilibium pacificum]|uniref:Oligosaccharide flippase family protein n=1 Tax=Marinigracilibium pacificum TaxID=2729599 RepID=A0A848J280_9BACT|nr:oligosaccharide flippase family protein [Marinigracilibium pacificum]